MARTGRIGWFKAEKEILKLSFRSTSIEDRKPENKSEATDKVGTSS
jgi:hypothetical protein